MGVWILWSDTIRYLLIVHLCFQCNNLSEKEEWLIDMLSLFNSHVYTICSILITNTCFPCQATFGAHKHRIGISVCTISGKLMIADLFTSSKVDKIKDWLSYHVCARLLSLWGSGNWFDVKAEQGVTSWWLMIHSSLSIVPVKFSKLQKPDTFVIALDHILL